MITISFIFFHSGCEVVVSLCCSQSPKGYNIGDVMPHSGRSVLQNEAERKLKSKLFQEMLRKYYRQDYFRPRLSSRNIIFKRFRPVLISPRRSYVKRENIWDIGIRPVLNSHAKNGGERGKK